MTLTGVSHMRTITYAGRHCFGRFRFSREILQILTDARCMHYNVNNNTARRLVCVKVLRENRSVFSFLFMNFEKFYSNLLKENLSQSKFEGSIKRFREFQD